MVHSPVVFSYISVLTVQAIECGAIKEFGWFILLCPFLLIHVQESVQGISVDFQPNFQKNLYLHSGIIVNESCLMRKR